MLQLCHSSDQKVNVFPNCFVSAAILLRDFIRGLLFFSLVVLFRRLANKRQEAYADDVDRLDGEGISEKKFSTFVPVSLVNYPKTIVGQLRSSGVVWERRFEDGEPKLHNSFNHDSMTLLCVEIF